MFKSFFCLKVFPSSFSIKAALGNLRISDDSLPSNHMYFWVCDMRDPGGTSFVEVFDFTIILYCKENSSFVRFMDVLLKFATRSLFF